MMIFFMWTEKNKQRKESGKRKNRYLKQLISVRVFGREQNIVEKVLC